MSQFFGFPPGGPFAGMVWRDLPSWLDAETMRWVWLVRDADKLDAMRIFDDAWETDRLRSHPEMCWNMPPEGDPTEALCEEVAAGRLGSYALVRSLADFQLVLLPWAFDLHFPVTRGRATANGVFGRLVGRLQAWPVTRPAIDRALAALS